MDFIIVLLIIIVSAVFFVTELTDYDRSIPILSVSGVALLFSVLAFIFTLNMDYKPSEKDVIITNKLNNIIFSEPMKITTTTLSKHPSFKFYREKVFVEPIKTLDNF